jgi:small GTP-binding protein
MSFDQVDYIIKTITIGDAGVGKTTMLRKLSESGYMPSNAPTIGVDFFTVTTKVNSFDIKMHIWDTAGHERYQNLVKTYYKNNAICYVVYDVCNYSSFGSVPMWINTFKNNTSNTNAIIVILANKIDQKSKRVITYEQGKTFADNYNALYIEISSNASIGLDRLIIEPVLLLLDMYEKNIFASGETNGFRVMTDNVNENTLNVNKAKTCCVIQ